jgi:phage N-6-adenine-methyltransferase
MNRVVFSSASDHWATPKAVYAALDEEFRFTFDPCPLMAEESGLLKKWTGRVFCNPPYSAIDDFLKKGLWHLSQRDCELLVYLIPSRTDTRWFHEYCIKASEIRFLRGRLKFGDAKNSAPFPSMLAIFKEWEIPLIQMEAA